MFNASIQYVTIKTKKQLVRNRIIDEVLAALIMTGCFVVMSFGAGYPWWLGLIIVVPVVTLYCWLDWKHNLDVLYLGEKSTAEAVRELPRE